MAKSTMRTLYFYFVAILTLLLSSCDKEYIYEEFEKPSANIVVDSLLSGKQITVYVEINLGAGTKIRDAYLLLNDITEPENQEVKINMNLSKEKNQTLNLTIDAPIAKHDYKAKVFLKSETNTYTSTPEILRFSGKFPQDYIDYVDLYIPDLQYDYFDDTHKVARYLQRGAYFLINVHYSKIPAENTPAQVYLNGNISCKIEISWWGRTENGDVNCGAYIPDDIASGIYEVSIKIGEKLYSVDYKIAVLPATIQEYYLPYPEYYDIDKDNYLFYNNKIHWFVNYNDSQAPYYYVQCWNMTTQQWEEKTTLPCTGWTLQQTHIQLDNRFFFIKTNKYLAEYDPDNNTLTNLTNYPGQGVRFFTAFALNNAIYMGAGLNSGDNAMKDFWKFDLITNQWTKLKDVTYSIQNYYDYVMSSVIVGSDAYIITCTKQIWKYNANNDTWTELSTIPLGPSPYWHGHLMLHPNGKLYLTTDYYYYSTYCINVWEYTIEENSWRLIMPPDLMGVSIFYGSPTPSFIYDGNIYIGYKSYTDYSDYSQKAMLYNVKLIK